MPIYRRIMGALRSLSLSFFVAIALVVLVELSLRLFAPQSTRLVELSDTAFAVSDSLLGSRYVPNASGRHTTPEFEVVYTINDQGHRDPAPYHDKTAETVRVLLVGDSFTFGHGVSYDDAWATMLARHFESGERRIEFINAGIQGYDTRSEYLYLKEIIETVKPNLVLLTFLPNDLFTNTHPDSAPTIVATSRKSRPRVSDLHVLNLAKRMILRNDQIYANLYAKSSRGQYYAIEPGPRLEQALAITREILTMTAELCANHGARFAVISIPQFFQVVCAAREIAFDALDVWSVDNTLSAHARTVGFPWYTTLNELTAAQSQAGDTYFRLDGHLTPSGNAVVSKIATAAVAELVATLEHEKQDATPYVGRLAE